MMTDKNDRNRPVFRPRPDEEISDEPVANERTPRVEETEDANSPGRERREHRSLRDAEVRDEETEPRSRMAKTEMEAPATVAPAPRSAFAKTGSETRGRMRSVPDPATEADRERERERDRERDRDRESDRHRDRGAAGDYPREKGRDRTAVAGGDTVPAMPSVDYDSGRGRGHGRGGGPGGRGPQRPGGRPAQLPKPRRHVAPPPGRFGFFGFLFGLIGLIVRMLIVTILVGGIVGFASYFIIQWYIKTPQVTVPNIRGMRIQQAFETLSDKGFAMARERAEPSALVAPGEVIEQRPAPGIRTKEGTTIRVVVSSGKSNFVVPDVRGETRDSAINKIKGAQLEVGNVTFLPDEKIPADVVITQNPEPNKGLETAAKVDLLVSSGTAGQPLTMPDVANVTVSEARARLSRLGINNVQTDPPNAEAGATVAVQEPLVGKLVRQTDQVTLQIKK